MLGLLDLMKIKPEKTDICSNTQTSKRHPVMPTRSYAQAVKGYDPVGQYSDSANQYMEIQQISTYDKGDLKSVRHDVQEDSEDSGCHSLKTASEDSLHDSSFTGEIMLNEADQHVDDLDEETLQEIKNYSPYCAQDDSNAESVKLTETNETLDDVNGYCQKSCEQDFEYIENEEENDEDESDDDDDDDEEEEEEAESVNNSNQVQAHCSDEESEGGWISDGDEMKQSANSDVEDEQLEMFDLFGDDTIIDYDEIERQVLSYPEKKPSKSKPTVPVRTYKRHEPNKLESYPQKKTTQYRQRTLRRSHGIQEDENMMAAVQVTCTKPVAKNKYAFPRVEPDDIDDVCEIWETDFQVDKSIIPKMSTWEKLGICPKRSDDAEDYETYLTYKSLYDRWLQCHQSKEQWYRKYGWSSLWKVLHYRQITSNKKYPEDCEAIPGLKEKLEVFESYYNSLAMSTEETTKSSCTKSSYTFNFTRSVSNETKSLEVDVR